MNIQITPEDVDIDPFCVTSDLPRTDENIARILEIWETFQEQWRGEGYIDLHWDEAVIEHFKRSGVVLEHMVFDVDLMLED